MILSFSYIHKMQRYAYYKDITKIVFRETFKKFNGYKIF